MKVDSLETVFFTSIFLLPGYLSTMIIYSICPGSKKGDGQAFLHYLGMSIFNLAVWSWAYILVYQSVEWNTVTSLLLSVLIAVIGSIILGFAFGIIQQKGLIRKIAAKFNVSLTHPSPTAWEYQFSKAKANWLIITLIDDSAVAGKYGMKSFSSSDTNQQDIYIEEVYDIDENKVWFKHSHTDGILISKNQIKHIEFYNNGDDEQLEK